VAEPSWLDVAGGIFRKQTLQRERRRLIMGGLCFLVPSWCPTPTEKGEEGMFGENLQLITKQCRLCKRWFALRADPEDIQRHLNVMFVQHAFTDRRG